MAGTEQSCYIQVAFAGFCVTPVTSCWTSLNCTALGLGNDLKPAGFKIALPWGKSLALLWPLVMQISFDVPDSWCTFLRLGDPLPITQLTETQHSFAPRSLARCFPSYPCRQENKGGHAPLCEARPPPPLLLASETLLLLLKSLFKCFLFLEWALNTEVSPQWGVTIFYIVSSSTLKIIKIILG